MKWVFRNRYGNRFKDVVNLTSQFQRCTDAVITSLRIYCEVNLLSNFEATLTQRSKFDVVVSRFGGRYESDIAI